MTKKKTTHKVEIACNFGSTFQEETALKALQGLLNVWSAFYRNTHKGNEIKVVSYEETVEV